MRYGFKHTVLILLGIIFSLLNSSMQSQSIVSPQLTKEERFAKLEPKMIFPLIKGSKMTGVVPVDFATNTPDPKSEVKLIFDFTQATANNAQSSHINEGLEEVVRILNLHIASGIQKEKLKAVVVFHSGSINSLLNNEYYQAYYKSNNPNQEILQKMANVGVQLIVCGQSVQFRELQTKQFMTGMQFALSAKTTLSKYQKDDYILFTVNGL